jgi:uncharacterized integral membrane protein
MAKLKPFTDWPRGALLHLHKTLAYGLFFLGALLGVVTVTPRVMELKGGPPDSLVVASLMGGVLLVALLCIVVIMRISRELDRRLSSNGGGL